MTDGGSDLNQNFPLWKALALLEEFVSYSWRDGAPRPLDSIHQLSRKEVASFVEVFELVFVATHYVTSVVATLATGSAEHSAHVPRGPDALKAKVDAILDEEPLLGQESNRIELESARAGDAPFDDAMWALREFLSLVEGFVTSLSFGDEVEPAWINDRFARYDLLRIDWLKKAGDTVAAACGLVLMEVEHLSTNDNQSSSTP